ncbi:maltodextrin phosphorylase [bacterium BMS3Bbin01]|nr:maltodextrin phosphorylase [bacterium BMS3Bbin01]
MTNVQIPVLPDGELPLPGAFSRLYDLAYNMWWTWSGGSHLWWMIDADLWTRYRNPIELLAAVDRPTWRTLEDSGDFQELYEEMIRRFDAYMHSEDTWWAQTEPGEAGPIAYLCAEYGVDNLLPTYSGGLGVLAGDHTKSASDLGIPLVATGLLYRRGYFRQEVDAVGDQQHTYPVVDPVRLPTQQVAGPTGGRLKIDVELPGRLVKVGVWKVQVGRVPILLLDTDLQENDDADRPITHTLYIRGREMRFVQEYILGIGSVRALAALGIEPTTWHVNEGHAALSLLERTARLITGGSTTEQAQQQVKATTSFTLHTPVPAGNEVFDFPLVEKYLSNMPRRLSIHMGQLAGMGAAHEDDEQHFNMTALAIRFASFVNGVSRRHAEIVSRDWAHLLPGTATAVTNGIHPSTWLGRGYQRLLGEIFGPQWHRTLIDDPSAIARLDEISDQRLWEIHTSEKRQLSRFARGRILQQQARQGASPDALRAIANILSPDRLTIGFARRFATYKRALLLFHNMPWLQAILTNPDRPVQILIAGKAHPADQNGQGLIRRIVELSRTPELGGHVHFLENYDMRMAGFLVQGVDVWLNNPRPPLEASGTSGMKAAINGGLNLSILDGWWLEGHNGKNGWAFGLEWGNGDHAAQDNEDAIALYRTLQDEVVPKYYDRQDDGIPHAWVAMMREAMRSTLVAFSSDRMVKEYATYAYLPLSRQQASGRQQ